MPITIQPIGIGRYSVLVQGSPVGTVECGFGQFHAKTCHLTLRLDKPDPHWAQPLFDQLQRAVQSPLQIGLSSADTEMADFLTAGGFQRKRRCYEVEARRPDWVPQPTVPLFPTAKGSPEYGKICRLYYTYYAQTHEAVSPLTASFADFCGQLPGVAYCTENLSHYAFVEGNEIAYIGSTGGDIRPFVHSLIEILFADYDTIFFESDDCDEAAMTLKNAFQAECTESFDTYIRPLRKE